MNHDIRDANAEPPAEPKIIEAKSISLNESGQLQPSDHNQLKAVVKTIAEGGGFPKRFDTLPKQIAAYNLSRALMGDRWQMALNNIADIQGQMTIYGEMPRALAENTREVKEFKIYAIDKDYKEICTTNRNLDSEVYAGVCEVQRIGRDKKEFTYSIDEAKKAGQYPPMKAEWVNNKRTGNMIQNEDSPWSKFTKIMLLRKAQAMAVKFEFPDALAGAPIAEYDTDELPDYMPVKDVTPTVDKAALINEKFNQPSPSAAPSVNG